MKKLGIYRVTVTYWTLERERIYRHHFVSAFTAAAANRAVQAGTSGSVHRNKTKRLGDA